MMSYRRNEKKQTGSKGSPHGIGYLNTSTYIGGPTSGLIFDVFILTPSKTCFGRSMKEYVEGTLKGDPWLIKPYDKAIGGHTCRRMQPNTSKIVKSVNGSLH